MSKPEKIHLFGLGFGLAMVTLALDQLSKWWIVNFIMSKLFNINFKLNIINSNIFIINF